MTFEYKDIHPGYVQVSEYQPKEKHMKKAKTIKGYTLKALGSRVDTHWYQIESMCKQLESVRELTQQLFEANAQLVGKVDELRVRLARLENLQIKPLPPGSSAAGIAFLPHPSAVLRTSLTLEEKKYLRVAAQLLHNMFADVGDVGVAHFSKQHGLRSTHQITGTYFNDLIVKLDPK